MRGNVSSNTAGLESPRVAYLDSLKGLAVVLVILGHIAQKYRVFDLYHAEVWKIECLESVIYSFHMQLFMLISGFLFDRAYCLGDGNIKTDRFKRQFRNILMIYVIYSVLEGIVKICFSQNVVSTVTITDILLLFIKPIGGRLWYLYVLLEYYLIFSRRSIQKNIGKPWLLVAVVLISSLNIFTDYEWLFSIRRAIRDLLPFYLGILISRYDKTYFLKKKYIFIWCLVIILRLVLYGMGFKANTIPVISVLYASAVSLGLYFLFYEIGDRLKGFALPAIGKCAIVMFLMQEYPLTVCTIVLPKLIKNAWLSMLINLLITIISIFIFDYVMKKLHIHDWLFKPYSQIEKRRGCC